jgi:hypothetical protein
VPSDLLSRRMGSPSQTIKSSVFAQLHRVGAYMSETTTHHPRVADANYLPDRRSRDVSNLSRARRQASQRFRLAAAIRARPSGVRGPVLRPPWLGQRPFFSALRLHGCPARVLAPHRKVFLRIFGLPLFLLDQSRLAPAKGFARRETIQLLRVRLSPYQIDLPFGRGAFYAFLFRRRK